MTQGYDGWRDAGRRLYSEQQAIDRAAAERLAYVVGVERICQASMQFIEPINRLIGRFIGQMNTYGQYTLQQAARQPSNTSITLRTAAGFVFVSSCGGWVHWEVPISVHAWRDANDHSGNSMSFHVNMRGAWRFVLATDVCDQMCYGTEFGYDIDGSLRLSSFRPVREGNVVQVVADCLAAVLLACHISLPS